MSRTSASCPRRHGEGGRAGRPGATRWPRGRARGLQRPDPRAEALPSWVSASGCAHSVPVTVAGERRLAQSGCMCAPSDSSLSRSLSLQRACVGSAQTRESTDRVVLRFMLPTGSRENLSRAVSPSAVDGHRRVAHRGRARGPHMRVTHGGRAREPHTHSREPRRQSQPQHQPASQSHARSGGVPEGTVRSDLGGSWYTRTGQGPEVRSHCRSGGDMETKSGRREDGPGRGAAPHRGAGAPPCSGRRDGG